MPEIKDRLICVDRLYFQPHNQQATGVEHQFVRELDTHEQPYIRKCVATETPQSLKCGWISGEQCGMLLITNDEGLNLQKIPTEEEKQAIAKKVLRLYRPGSSFHWIIPPGESFRGYPSDCELLDIESASGEINYTLHLFPR